MGKAAKSARSEERKRQKRAEKARKQALYMSYAAAGKSKRKTSGRRLNGIKTKRHEVSNCGNNGCSRITCFPHLAAPKMNDSSDPRVRFRTTSQQKADGLFA